MPVKYAASHKKELKTSLAIQLFIKATQNHCRNVFHIQTKSITFVTIQGKVCPQVTAFFPIYLYEIINTI